MATNNYKNTDKQHLLKTVMHKASIRNINQRRTHSRTWTNSSSIHSM